ncbi:MAG: hypothetical protein LUC88_04770 [Prevotella sp.]|nr:hypothetical protein [Prevotella sp.]
MRIQSKLGNESLLERRKTAFLCSRMVSDAVTVAVNGWLDTLSVETDCVMCGNHSPMEKVVFERLLRDKVPAILVLAEALHEFWDAQVEAALREGRLLIITHCDAGVHTVSSRSAFDRNLLMLMLADKIVIGFCKKGGNLERVLAGFGNVTYLYRQAQEIGRATEPVGVSRYTEKDNYLKESGIWSKEGSYANGSVTVELNRYGKEAYLKIIQESGTTRGVLGERLTFNRGEFAVFHRAIKHLKETFNATEERHDSIVVKSESGEVTVDYEQDDNCGVFVMMQSKRLANKQLREREVRIQVSEFPAFCEMLDMAASQWKL